MIPYYLLSRDSRQVEQLARDLNSYSQSIPNNRPPVNISEMISSGTLHTVNAVERGLGRMASLFGR